MAGLLDLARSMTKLADRLPYVGNFSAKDAASTILKDLTEVTPVDTGLALSNWVVTTDVPNLSVIRPFAPSPSGRMRNGVWTHTVDPVITAQANAPMVLSRGQSVIQSKNPGQVLFITNHVDYIGELDRGTSTQQPGGFIDRAIILGKVAASRVKVFP